MPRIRAWFSRVRGAALGKNRRHVANDLERRIPPRSRRHRSGFVSDVRDDPTISSQLYGVSARDPLSLILVIALLTAISLLACLGAARRALHIDPAIALRAD